MEVDQYALSEPSQDEEGEPVPESFDFIAGQGPNVEFHGCVEGTR